MILRSLCSIQEIFTVAISKFVYFVSRKDTFYFISYSWFPAEVSFLQQVYFIKHGACILFRGMTQT